MRSSDRHAEHAEVAAKVGLILGAGLTLRARTTSLLCWESAASRGLLARTSTFRHPMESSMRMTLAEVGKPLAAGPPWKRRYRSVHRRVERGCGSHLVRRARRGDGRYLLAAGSVAFGIATSTEASGRILGKGTWPMYTARCRCSA